MDSAAETQSKVEKAAKTDSTANDSTDMSNILTHIKSLETKSKDLEAKLEHERQRNQKLSQKTREGMQSALDTLMTKWMDAVETKDAQTKDHFKSGLETLVSKSAEDNGVWQMMVAASALHERQEHNLEKIRSENVELRTKVDGMYADSSSRTVGHKDKTISQGSRDDVVSGSNENMWEDFAKQIGTMY